ncbi:MAG TPA: hypothetical protein VJ724_06515 [Tahibacter sp.]|nr:hypothetical protein [Tahibacter sp.]
MPALLPAELAWYVTGRFYATSDGFVADYGYFLHLAGIDGGLFADDTKSESTAYFTFAAQPFKPGGVTNGALNLGIDPAGEFSIWLQRTPAGNFDDPSSFARGECIATLRRVSVVVGTTVSAGSPSAPILASNVFSARIVDAVPFEFRGARYDLREILGAGITQFGTAAETSIEPALLDYVAVLPFSGSALALKP